VAVLRDARVGFDSHCGHGRQLLDLGRRPPADGQSAQTGQASRSHQVQRLPLLLQPAIPLLRLQLFPHDLGPLHP